MFNFKKKLTYFIVLITCFLLLIAIVPPLRPRVIDITKYPLTLIRILKQEAVGLVFYHHSLITSERLNTQVNILKQRLNNMQEIALENIRLKKMLSFRQKSSYKMVAARVIARSPDNWSSVIILDKGLLNGIRQGMAVITARGFVGAVIDVTKLTSTVMLVSDPNFAVSCLIQRSRQEGLISGALGNLLLMKYLPADADVGILDIVVTSGLTQTYPKGLLVGTVVEIGEEVSGLGRWCLVKPIVNLNSLEEVFVIIQ